MRRAYLAASVARYSGLLVAAWITHGTGVIKNNPKFMFNPEVAGKDALSFKDVVQPGPARWGLWPVQ